MPWLVSGNLQACTMCLMLTCNNKNVLPFETPKRSSKLAFGLRRNFKAKVLVDRTKIDYMSNKVTQCLKRL